MSGTLNEIKSVVSQKVVLSKANEEIGLKHQECKIQQDTAISRLANCTTSITGILQKIVSLQLDFQKFGTTINFEHNSQEKEDLAFKVLDILGQFGYYKGEPIANPILAKNELVNFQRLKLISPPEGYLGKKTFIQFINEYAALESKG